jgi:Tfp pilus assembly protein PilF
VIVRRARLTEFVLRTALLVAVFLAAAPARASEESQALGARALVELNAGREQAALTLLDRAVAADPSDADAFYLRGSTRAKLGDNEGAIQDLQAALAQRPNFPAAALELGVALTETGRYAAAEPWLAQAQRDPSLDAQASFFLGLAQLRLDRLDEAQANFARARAGDPSLDLSTQYYEGVIAFRRGDLDTAEARFTAVENASPDSAMGREAAQFLVLTRRAQRAAYSLFGTVAYEYDSNVTLGPTTEQFGATGQGDSRVVLNAGGRYVPLRLGPASLALSYEFFQSLQFHLTSFDLQDHRPAVDLQFNFDPVYFGLLGRYDYYLLETDSFLQEATGFPWVTLREEGIGRTDIFYRFQWRDYKQTSFEILNGFYNFAGVRQVIDLGAPGRQLWAGYQLGFASTDDQSNCIPSVGDMEPLILCSDEFEYGSNQVEVGLRWPLPYSVSSEVGYRYEHQSYDGASSVLEPVGSPRRDNDHRVIVSFERPLAELSEHLFVVASWFGTWNNSNKTLFEYTRQIGSIGAEVRF